LIAESNVLEPNHSILAGISIDVKISLLVNVPDISVAFGKYVFQSSKVITDFLSKPTEATTALSIRVA
jgi:hypothetical protein